MKRVLFVIATLKGGGAERVLSNIVTHFPAGWQIDILVNSLSSVEYPYKGNILSLSLPEPGGKKSLCRLFREVGKRTVYLRKRKKENRYDACVSFLPSSNISNILSGNRYCKTIVSIHSRIIDEKFGIVNKAAVFFFFKVLYIHADRIITVSRETALDLIRRVKIAKDKVDSIVNGCDREWVWKQMKLLPENKANACLLPEGEKTVVTVGRMTEEKGQWHLIRAFSEVVKQEPKSKLLMIGEGILEKYLAELVEAYHLKENVVFTGHTDNPFWYYATGDIFVLPSLYEGYPNVLVEAVCCGMPCIAADVHSGAREILGPGLDVAGKRVDDISEEEYGILIPVCSGKRYQYGEALEPEEKKMADAIVMLLRSREKRIHYRQKSMERSRDLDIGAIVNQWVNSIVE